MKSRRGGADTVAPRGRTPAAGQAAERRQTLLLPLVLEGIDDEAPLSVLDVGSGVAETVEYFSRYRCRLHFADLFDATELRQVPDEDADAYFDAAFAGLLDFPDDTRFDICLLWDFLNRLPLPALRAFGRALRPYLHARTRGHGFGAFKATAPGMSWSAPQLAFSYGVVDHDALIVRPRPADGGMALHSHSRTVLAESFACFEIVRGTLLQEGAMELLLRAR